MPDSKVSSVPVHCGAGLLAGGAQRARPTPWRHKQGSLDGQKRDHGVNFRPVVLGKRSTTSIFPVILRHTPEARPVAIPASIPCSRWARQNEMVGLQALLGPGKTVLLTCAGSGCGTACVCWSRWTIGAAGEPKAASVASGRGWEHIGNGVVLRWVCSAMKTVFGMRACARSGETGCGGRVGGSWRLA